MNSLKHWIQQRLIQAKISDNELLESICLECKQANHLILKAAIKKHKFLHNDKNTHEELWRHNDNIFELDVVDEEHDWHLEATIEPEEETGLFICHYNESSLGLDRDNIINEMYIEALGLNENKSIKNADYKVIMREIYYMFQGQLNRFIKQKGRK